MYTTNKLNLRMSDIETRKFVKIYGDEPCLWNTSDLCYKDRRARDDALNRIVTAMNIRGFGVVEAVQKFKNLRSSYCQELKKIKRSLISNESEPPVYLYKPKVIWFDIMDNYLRPFVQQRDAKKNESAENNDFSESSTDLKEFDEVNYRQNQENLHGVLKSSEVTIDRKGEEEENYKNEEYKGGEGVKTVTPEENSYTGPSRTKSSTTPNSHCNNTRDHKQNSILNRRKHESKEKHKRFHHKNSLISKKLITILEKFHSIIESSENSTRIKAEADDIFQVYGNYVASVLKSLPQNKAFHIQNQINETIAKELMKS